MCRVWFEYWKILEEGSLYFVLGTQRIEINTTVIDKLHSVVFGPKSILQITMMEDCRGTDVKTRNYYEGGSSVSLSFGDLIMDRASSISHLKTTDLPTGLRDTSLYI